MPRSLYGEKRKTAPRSKVRSPENALSRVSQTMAAEASEAGGGSVPLGSDPLSNRVRQLEAALAAEKRRRSPNPHFLSEEHRFSKFRDRQLEVVVPV